MATRKWMEGYRGHWIWQWDNEEFYRISNKSNEQIKDGLTRMQAVQFINRLTGSDSDSWDFSR